MEQVLKQLQVIFDVSLRLEALAQSKGLAETVTKRMLEESASLRWAHKELRQHHFNEVLCVIGQGDFVNGIGGLRPENINLGEPPLALAILFDPDAVVATQIHDSLVGSNWPGNKLPADKPPKWLYCERYFACGDDQDVARRAVLLHCLIDKKWLTDIGLAKAKVMLHGWLHEIYKSMRWDNARKVEK